MQYVDKKNGKLFTVSEIKSLNRNISFPASGPSQDWLEKVNMAVVVDQRPEVPEGKIVNDKGVQKINGEYKKVYELVDKPIPEPSENEVLLKALEAKVGITEEDKETARANLRKDKK